MKRVLISMSISVLLVSLGLNSSVALAQRKKTIYQAAVDGDVDRVKALLAEGGDVNEKDPRMGYAPLHSAARNGRKAVVELLLEKGADINAKEKGGRTALCLAVEYGRLAAGQKEVIELLLAKGADINATSGRGENALSLAQKKGNTEIEKLLLAKGATGPVVQNAYEDEYYGDEGMSPGGRGGRGPATPAVEVDLLADPTEIQTRIKTFDGLEKGIVDLAKKSATEMKYWGPSRNDNRSYVARAVKKQVEDELAFVKKIAVEEKATKTTAAIDVLVKQRHARHTKVSRALSEQRREALQTESSSATGGQFGGRSSGRSSGRTSGRSSGRTSGRTSGRSSSRGRYSQGSQGYDGGGGAYGAGETGRGGRPGRPTEQVDRATQDAIQRWTQATADNKSELAKTVYPQIHAEFAVIRLVAVEEKAEKTTAAIDGILLARQVRFDVYVKITEELKRTAATRQDPRTADRYGGEEAGRAASGRRGRTSRGGTTGTQQQGGRTRRR